MPTTTRAMVLEHPEELRLREFVRPQIGPDEALLAVELAGICGTDAKTFHGKLPYPTPLIMGHEILGHVAETGRDLGGEAESDLDAIVAHAALLEEEGLRAGFFPGQGIFFTEKTPQRRGRLQDRPERHTSQVRPGRDRRRRRAGH